MSAKNSTKSYLEAQLQVPGFRKAFHQAQVEHIVEDLQWELEQYRRKVRDALKALRIANRNLSDGPTVNLSIAVAITSLSGKKEKGANRGT